MMNFLNRRLRPALLAAAIFAAIGGCADNSSSATAPPTQDLNVGKQHPQTIVLLATPKFIHDFDAPDNDIARFFDQYAPLTSRAAKTIVIFAVGNSDHILNYRGKTGDGWDYQAEWAHFTDFISVDERKLNYFQIAAIVQSFRRQAAERGITLQVYDMIDSGNEFAVNVFKLINHTECFPTQWLSYDIRGSLKADNQVYATEPTGIPAGLNCGKFLVNQVAQYINDLGFDGILYGNQLGTRGRWLATNGPGWSEAEADSIRSFFAYSKQMLGSKGLMWFDSYNNTTVEHDTWSVPIDAYSSFDYLIAAGFCVVTDPAKYEDDLKSKLLLRPHPLIIATLDYVDPWYSYDSMTSYPAESATLEDLAVKYRFQVDGLVFFANDHLGQLVPEGLIASFANRYFPLQTQQRLVANPPATLPGTEGAG